MLNHRTHVGRSRENTRNLLEADSGGPRRGGRGFSLTKKEPPSSRGGYTGASVHVRFAGWPERV